MLIFPRQRLTYLAIPKTGTTAIEAALAPRSGINFKENPFKHMSLAEYRQNVLPFMEFDPRLQQEFETVCVIRHPMERLRSWYKYGTNLKKTTKGQSFPDFVEDFLETRAAEDSQAAFVRDGDRSVDVMIRYGDPGIEDFFAQRLGVFTPIFRRNVSPQRAIEPLPSTLERCVRDVWAADFELFESLAPLQVQSSPRPPVLKRLTQKAIWALGRIEGRLT